MRTASSRIISCSDPCLNGSNPGIPAWNSWYKISTYVTFWHQSKANLCRNRTKTQMVVVSDVIGVLPREYKSNAIVGHNSVDLSALHHCWSSAIAFCFLLPFLLTKSRSLGPPNLDYVHGLTLFKPS